MVGVIACVLFLFCTAGEYGAIARRQLQQNYAVSAFVHGNSTEQLLDIQRNTLNGVTKSDFGFKNYGLRQRCTKTLFDPGLIRLMARRICVVRVV